MFQLDSVREGVVAAEAEGGELRLYFHDGDSFRMETENYFPVLLLSAPPEAKKGVEVSELSGSAPLRWLCRFESEKELDAVRKAEEKAKRPLFVFRDQLTPALIFSGLRLFGGMDFSALRRLQFSAEGDENRLSALRVLFDGKLEEWRGSETEICEGFLRCVREYDPDVIEGYNCCRFDWPRIAAAFKRCAIPASLGRGGALLRSRPSRLTFGDRQVNYTRFDASGRHLLDLWQQVQLYDVARRDMEGFEAEDLKEYFGFDPAMDDLTLCREVGNTLTPSFFYYSCFLPMRFQEAVIRGNGSRIDTLLTGLYLAAGRALPLPEPSRPFTGAIAGVERSGVFRPAWHCDVRSLYPSILIAGKRGPCRDEAGLFLRLLEELRTFRLKAKDAARLAVSPAEKRHWNALQSTFKIMINSFYGYLGFAQGSFNDYELAAAVTAAGREILTGLAAFLSSSGAKVIEMDTDGIYFSPPEEAPEPEAFQKRIQATLPPGIEIELDAVFPAMFSYKAKNYALLNSDGTVSLTGAALKSRGMEPFLRNFLRESLTLLLTGRKNEIAALYENLLSGVERKTLRLELLARSETLNDAPANYRRKLEAGTGRRSAAYELALASGREFRAGDKVTYYITGEKPKVSVVDNSCLLSGAPAGRDENVAFYRKKLEELYDTFSPFFAESDR